MEENFLEKALEQSFVQCFCSLEGVFFVRKSPVGGLPHYAFLFVLIVSIFFLLRGGYCLQLGVNVLFNAFMDPPRAGPDLG